ncbi:MAG: HAMP domain-containing histidine kinase [Candidatus Tectomicrobia bacterium]|nr:HAMP domain-containing histidine kinase [Candidatus Tectomicrobia bacterium]
MQKLLVVKVKIYTLDGRTVFSTQASQVGQDKSTNAGFLSARAGQVASELTHRDTFSAFEQTIEDRDVLSSYLPIQRGASTSPIEGVFEIYTDVTPLLLRIERRQRTMVVGVILGLSLLYAILYVIVRRADSTITSQHTELASEILARRQAEETVRQHNANLEMAVQQRTAQLEVAKEAAEASSRAKSEFLGNMSHELRTPLHSILSFGDLGLDKVETAPTTKLKRYFEQIVGSGQTLIALVDDMLDLSKMDAGKMEFTFEMSDLRELLATVADEFSSLVAARHITITLSPTDPCTEVVLDRVKIQQVMRNLLSNAVKFTPDGSTIELRLDVEPGAVKVQVSDQGPGIPETEVEMIFDKFAQSSRTKTGAGGTGLGLAICRELVAAHNGTIWAENTAEGGALVTFMLPRHQPEAIGQGTTPVSGDKQTVS